MDTNTFLRTHRVFSLDEAAQAIAPAGGRTATLERLKYAVATGKLKNLARGVYATVPPGVASKDFQADRFLTAAALRPDAIFSHHSALELLGAAHSDWQLCTAYTSRRAQPFSLNGVELRYLSHPLPLVRGELTELGTRKMSRLDRELTVTGPERTLIDGFRRPDLVGGHAEFIESAAGFSVIELPLLFELLDAFGQKLLWAAVGWFLETYQKTFFVGDENLSWMEKRVPKTPLYLDKNQRGGTLVKRWNVIVPSSLVEGMEPNELQR